MRPRARVAVRAIILVALALTVVPTAQAESVTICQRMRLYVVTGHKVEPQFRVYTGRLVTRGVSCPLARSVVRTLNLRLLTNKRSVSVQVSGRRWDCLRAPNYRTGYLDSQCDRATARIDWKQTVILD